MAKRQNEASIWERRSGESAEAYAAFSLYRDMAYRTEDAKGNIKISDVPLVRRSARAVAVQVGKNESLLERWSVTWDWVNRAEAYDRFIDAEALRAEKLILLTDTPYPRLQLTFLEPDTFRGPLEVDAEEYIAVKGFKAKGKRLTTFALDQVKELEPTRFPEPETEEEVEEELEEVIDPDEGKSDGDIRDELTGQLKLF